MVFRRNRGSLVRRFSISEWAGAPIEQLSDSASDHNSSTEDISTNPSDDAPSPPEMNLGSVYNVIQTQTNREARNAEGDCASDGDATASDTPVHPESLRAPHRSLVKWEDDGKSGNYSRRRSSAAKLFHRRGLDDDATVEPSSSASRTSYSSSAGTNIWTKLLGGNDFLWDGINGKDAFDESQDDEFEDNSTNSLGNGPDGFKDDVKTCQTNMKRCSLSWWYEVKHWTKTIYNHPHIWMLSFAAFGVLCGVGMLAINSQRDNYIAKQKGTANFIVSGICVCY